VADHPRIEELRRRIQKDPASIAFAQLAEEHRRAGQFDEAVRVCRAGLAQHPAYLSARITLGRALLEMGRYDESAVEFEYVLKAAPDNLTAVRELADIEQRRRAGARHGGGEQQPAESPESPPSTQPDLVQEPPAIGPVVAELEAWLAVIADERAARPSRI
jgi:predicted Zn-dependent protease